MLNENILLPESQKEYFDKKQQVSVSQSFACRWIEGQRMKDEWRLIKWTLSRFSWIYLQEKYKILSFFSHENSVSVLQGVQRYYSFVVGWIPPGFLKVAAIDLRYFARSKLWQVVVKGGLIPLLNLNKLDVKSQATIILGNFVNKPWSDSYWQFLSLVKI